MPDRDERLLGLLERWQDDREQGRPSNVNELCADCPELAGDLEARIADVLGLERLGRLDEAGERPTSSCALAATTSLPQLPHGAPGRRSTPRAPVVPGYERLEYLGGGGMGDVWKAHDPKLDRPVALKLVRAEHLAAAARARLLAEARAVARLDHPNVVKVHAVGECRQSADGEEVPYIALEYVPGTNLTERVGNRPMEGRAAAHLAALLARAVQHAHERGILHRDLKPGNVLLGAPADVAAVNTPLGCPKVTDFGLARTVEGGDGLTQEGAVVGTPAYMAPEQASGLEVGPATDVYALGAILYQLLTGHAPFEADSTIDVLHKVRHESPLAPKSLVAQVPPALEAVCLRCLAKRPEERYPSAQALAEALEGWLSGSAVARDLPEAVGGARRPPWRLVLAGALAGLAGALLVLWLAGAFRPAGATNGGEAGKEGAERPAGDKNGDKGASGPAAAKRYRGSVTALVWRRHPDGTGQRLKLGDPEALPLRPGDRFRIEARVEPAAYLYVVGIAPDGKAELFAPAPLERWDQRGEERPVTAISLPASPSKGIRLPPGKKGMVTVLMLARARPWQVRAKRLRELFAELPEQRPIQDARSAVWFADGEVVEGDRERRRSSFEVGDLGDAVLRTQEVLRERLKGEADFTAAVGFAWAE
jgi:hypothetical protein